MQINSGIPKELIDTTVHLFERLNELGVFVREIEYASQFGKDHFNIHTLVTDAEYIEEAVSKLRRFYADPELRKPFDEVKDAARKLKRVSTEQKIEEICRPHPDYSPDSFLYHYTLDVVGSLMNLFAVLSSYTITLPLSGFAGNELTNALLKRNPQAAIQYAFTVFEERLRKRLNLGPEVFGETLINIAFGNNGRLSYGATPAEQRGARNYISGAYSIFRNPNMHRISTNDTATALSIIVIIDTLIKLVDSAEENPVTHT
jgi:hypothetical protein